MSIFFQYSLYFCLFLKLNNIHTDLLASYFSFYTASQKYFPATNYSCKTFIVLTIDLKYIYFYIWLRLLWSLFLFCWGEGSKKLSFPFKDKKTSLPMSLGFYFTLPCSKLKDSLPAHFTYVSGLLSHSGLLVYFALTNPTETQKNSQEQSYIRHLFLLVTHKSHLLGN